MPGVSYGTAFEVAPFTGIILYHSLERACIAAEPLRGHLSSGRVGVFKCIVLPRATKGSPWFCCYVKQHFTVGVDIFPVSIY
jgi:hypothetical protein